MSLDAIVRTVLAACTEYVPAELPFDEDHKIHVFALAAVRRMADLLEAELQLALAARYSVTRVLGRSIVELWLYANDLLLDGEAALDRLFGEDADYQARIEHGRGMFWQHVERHREQGIDLRATDFEPGERSKWDLESTAFRIRRLRQDRGLGSGIAEERYDLSYRWDSSHDVHTTVDLLFRYFHITSTAMILERPDINDETETLLRGPESVRNDALLVADVVGVYLTVAGKLDELESLKRDLATGDGQQV